MTALKNGRKFLVLPKLFHLTKNETFYFVLWLFRPFLSLYKDKRKILVQIKSQNLLFWKYQNETFWLFKIVSFFQSKLFPKHILNLEIALVFPFQKCIFDPFTSLQNFCQWYCQCLFDNPANTRYYGLYYTIVKLLLHCTKVIHIKSTRGHSTAKDIKLNSLKRCVSYAPPPWN